MAKKKGKLQLGFRQGPSMKIYMGYEKTRLFMNKEDILSFIKTSGYKTEAEIREKFKSDNQEILGGILEFYVSKGLIRKIDYVANSASGILYVAVL
jgi:predicted HTH transcriptional regulator